MTATKEYLAESEIQKPTGKYLDCILKAINAVECTAIITNGITSVTSHAAAHVDTKATRNIFTMRFLSHLSNGNEAPYDERTSPCSEGV